MPTGPRIAYVVSHTHWDREWYLPFHAFRVMLVRTVEGILDALEHDEAYRHFCLDGQAVVLEDHLEIRPEDEERLRCLAAKGALSLGPWYVLPDEFLIPPEATVRNLLLGHRVASRFGPVQKVGYVPDAFGHVAQMPQILRQAGIDSFVYTRGSGDEIDHLGLEWTWEAPDGTAVLAVQQCGGYCNAAALGFEEMEHVHTAREVDPARAVGQVHSLFDQLAAESNGDVWLLSNGCDHLPVQRDFARVMDALRTAFPETEFRHASLAEYITAVREAGFARKRWRGELRGGRLQLVLSGVWSTRMPLKQRNDEAHTLLADVCEPLAAYAFFRHGQAWPRGLLQSAWKLLLKNQPHDSICGCSVDEVHREMQTRFDGVVETADHLVRERMQTLAPTSGGHAEADRETVLALFNPLPFARRVVVERLVVLPSPDLDLEALRLVDEKERVVPFEIVDVRRITRFQGVDWRLELFPERQREYLETYERTYGDRFPGRGDEAAPTDTFVHLRFLADVPPIGHVLLRVVEMPDAAVPQIPPEARVRVRVSDGTLANEHVSVHIHPDGTFDLLDKRTGQRFQGLNVLEDVEDVGDEYDHSPATNSETVISRGVPGAVEVVEDGALAGCLEALFHLSLPARIEAGRERRSARRVDCPVCVRVRLDAVSPVVDVAVRFENRAEDHRLSAVFPTGVLTDRVVSDAHFLLAERDIDQPAGENWVQPPPATLPQCEFTLAQAGPRGLAVLVRGLPEVSVRRTADGSVGIAPTLLRSVGWLSRDDFPTRRFRNAGPTLPTPDAQCLGPHRFHYAVLPFAGDAIVADVKGWSRRWRTPLPCVQGVADGARPGGAGLFHIASTRVGVTAVKRHEERDTLVVRLVNLTDEAVEETLTFGIDLAAAFRVDLLEERGDELEVRGREVTILLRGHEIATVEAAPRI